LLEGFDSKQLDTFAQHLAVQADESNPVETSLIQLRDDNQANDEIDAGDEASEQPIGAQNTELSASAAIEQSAQALGGGAQET